MGLVGILSYLLLYFQTNLTQFPYLPSNCYHIPLFDHFLRRAPPLPLSPLPFSVYLLLTLLDMSSELLDKLQIFQIHGRDKRGRKVLRIIGKFFLARIVSVDVMKKYLEEKIFPELEKQPFAVVYLHTDVEKSDDFVGISALRSIYDEIPAKVRDNLEAMYFVHPGLQARLFLATFGRFLFSGGLYGKLRYISRVDYLWDHVRRNEVEIPDFVHDHDEDLEYRPMMDYGLESDHARIYGAPADSHVEVYSMRCIS